MSLRGTSTTITGAAAAPQPAIAEGVALARRHAAGIAIAVLFAAFLVAPRFWVLATEPDEGVRVPVSPYGARAIGYDEPLYTASIQQAADGIVPVADPYLVNHENTPPQRSAFPHIAIGLLSRVTGGVFPALGIATALAAVGALLLLYAMAYQITGSRWVAVATVPVVLVGIQVLNAAGGFLPLRHADVLEPILRADPERQAHPWARYAAPILGLAPIFALVIALPKAVETGGRGWMAAAVGSLALLIYTYAYYWTAVGLALVAVLALLLLRREREQALRLVTVGVLALLIALPEIVVLGWSALELPDEARDRLGVGELGIQAGDRMRILQRLVVGLPFLAVLDYRRMRDVFFAGLFLSPLVLTPITGVIPQVWHYHTQVWGIFAIPAVLAGGAALASRVRMPSLARPALAATGIVAVASGLYLVVLHARFISDTDAAFAISRDEDAAFDWLRDHASSSDTVVSPSVSTNLYLASLTSSAQYLAEGGFSTATDEELLERLLRAQAAYGYSEDEAFSRLDISGEFAGFPVNDPTLSTEELERDLENYLAFFSFSFEIEAQAEFTARVESWRPRYRELLASDGVLAAYPAEYLYCGPRERYFGAVDPAPGTYVVPAFESGDVVVYEIVDAATDRAVEFEGCGPTASATSAGSSASR